jgi:bacterial/archaeal transporter family-2 protein
LDGERHFRRTGPSDRLHPCARAGIADGGLTGWPQGALSPLKQVHPLLLTAGVLGACLVFAIAWLIPQIGTGPLMITLLAGLVLGGLLMSHLGWLGSPVGPVSPMKLLGVGVMVGGVVLATFSK